MTAIKDNQRSCLIGHGRQLAIPISLKKMDEGSSERLILNCTSVLPLHTRSPSNALRVRTNNPLDHAKTVLENAAWSWHSSACSSHHLSAGSSHHSASETTAQSFCLARIARLHGKTRTVLIWCTQQWLNVMHAHSRGPPFATSTLRSSCMPGRSPKGLRTLCQSHQPGQNHENAHMKNTLKNTSMQRNLLIVATNIILPIFVMRGRWPTFSRFLGKQVGNCWMLDLATPATGDRGMLHWMLYVNRPLTTSPAHVVASCNSANRWQAHAKVRQHVKSLDLYFWDKTYE